MAQNLDPNLNDPKQNLSRNLNDVDASNDDLGENTEQTPLAQAQAGHKTHDADQDERIHTITPDEDDGIRKDSEDRASAGEFDERIPTVTPYNENGIAGPDDEDDDDDTSLDDDDDDDDYEEIIPIEGDDDDLEDEYDDDEDDDEIEDRTSHSERIGVI